MSTNGYSSQRGMALTSSSLKRSASSFFESEHEEDTNSRSFKGPDRNACGSFRLIKRTKLPYPEAEARAAMRGELVYTPALRTLMESIIRDMRLTNQIEGRCLGSNYHYSKLKGILKQGQDEIINIERYLLCEAFIRTDTWNTLPLREFFELVHYSGLERMFRDQYWEKNQLAHPAKIQKLYNRIRRPDIRSANDKNLADQIENWAKDIMSRSVFVPRADHPIICSAVALMNIAEQQPKDDLRVWDKLQEGPKRTAQIWAAWCLARDKDWPETTYLAVIILDRARKNDTVRKCFRHEHGALMKLVDHGYNTESCKRWQDMYGKCHVISMQELLSRPVAFKFTSNASPSLSQKPAHTAEDTGNSISKVATTKARELASSSQQQLDPTRQTSIQQSPVIRRPIVFGALGRDATLEEPMVDVELYGSLHPPKSGSSELKQCQTKQDDTTKHYEVDLSITKGHESRQRPQKKQKTNVFDLDSPLRARSKIRRYPSASPAPATFTAGTTPAPAAAVADNPASIASTVSTAVDSAAVATMAAYPTGPADPISQWMNQPMNSANLANMVAVRLFAGTSGIPFNGHTVVAKTEHDILHEAWAKFETNLDKKLGPISQHLNGLSGDVNRAIAAIQTLENKQNAFEQTITKKLDGLAELSRTLQEDQEKLKATVDLAEKKLAKSSTDDEVADSIICAPVTKMTPSSRRRH